MGNVLEDLNIVFGVAVQNTLIDFQRDLCGNGAIRSEQDKCGCKNKAAHGILR
jgi:hypothetical protein